MPVSFDIPTTTTSDTTPPPTSLHSRVVLALSHVPVYSQKQHFISFRSSAEEEEGVDYVQKLLDECKTAWDDLIKHPFPAALAKGTAALNGFRHYMIQDAAYLEHYYRVRMESIAKSGTFEEIQEFAAKLSTSLQYVTNSRDDLTNKLGVPKASVTGEEQSQALKNSLALYQTVVKDGDWLDTHIVLLPCILGYHIIANRLLWDPDTIRNTVYFSLWIQANSGGSSATKYRKFINQNIGKLPDDKRKERWTGWVKNFNAACKNEKVFFDLGLANFPAYNIVNNGIYKIRSYGYNNHFLVGFSDSSVIISNGLNPGEGKWKLKDAKDARGYTLDRISEQGIVTGPGLDATIEDRTQPSYEVKGARIAPLNPWSINIVQVAVYDTKGQPLKAFQLFAPGSIQFALHATKKKAYVTNNSEISAQVWLLDPAT